MLGVIRPSLAGWSMMVLREEDAGVDIGPNINSEASPQTDPIQRIDTITRRFEAKLRCGTGDSSCRGHPFRASRTRNSAVQENKNMRRGSVVVAAVALTVASVFAQSPAQEQLA